ncbi:816_t:CDS:2, partial [Acaulospora morrowiae]
ESDLIGLMDDDSKNAAYYFLPTPPQTPMFEDRRESESQNGDPSNVREHHQSMLREIKFDDDLSRYHETPPSQQSSFQRNAYLKQQKNFPSSRQRPYANDNQNEYNFQKGPFKQPLYHPKYRNQCSQNLSQQEFLSSSNFQIRPSSQFISYNFQNKYTQRMSFPTFLSPRNKSLHSYQIFHPRGQQPSVEQQSHRQIIFPEPECQPRVTYQQRNPNIQRIARQSKFPTICEQHSWHSSKSQPHHDKQPFQIVNMGETRIQNKLELDDDPSYPSSYIRGWQTEYPCAQVHLVKIQFGDYSEYNIDKKIENTGISNNDHCNLEVDDSSDSAGDSKEDYLAQVVRIQRDRGENTNRIEISDRRYGPPKFRYRYMEESIQLCLLQNTQIWVPLKSLKSIEKRDKRVFKFELKDDLVARERVKEKITCHFDFYYPTHKRTLISESIKGAQCVTMITHKGVVEKELDIIGLHIDYIIKMLNADNQYDSIFLRWRAADWGSRAQDWYSLSPTEKHKEEVHEVKEWIIKCHVDDSTRIFRFEASTNFRTVKETIRGACQLPLTPKFEYKDDAGKFTIISGEDDFLRCFTNKNMLVKLRNLQLHKVDNVKLLDDWSSIATYIYLRKSTRLGIKVNDARIP